MHLYQCWIHFYHTGGLDIVTHVYFNYFSRYNMTSDDEQQDLRQPMSLIGDGHWTAPYYDCGGGDIWMVTYSSPIFGMDASGTPIFK